MLTVKDVNKMDLPKQDNYERALAIGLEKFGKKDPNWIAEKSGGRIFGGNLAIPHLNTTIVSGSADEEVHNSRDRRGSSYMVVYPLCPLFEFR